MDSTFCAKLLNDVQGALRLVYLSPFFFLEATARLTTLSFNRSVTGGFNLRLRGADSLDSISPQADTLLDVLHACTLVHVYSSGACTH